METPDRDTRGLHTFRQGFLHDFSMLLDSSLFAFTYCLRLDSPVSSFSFTRKIMFAIDK